MADRTRGKRIEHPLIPDLTLCSSLSRYLCGAAPAYSCRCLPPISLAHLLVFLIRREADSRFHLLRRAWNLLERPGVPRRCLVGHPRRTCLPGSAAHAQLCPHHARPAVSPPRSPDTSARVHTHTFQHARHNRISYLPWKQTRTRTHTYTHVRCTDVPGGDGIDAGCEVLPRVQ